MICDYTNVSFVSIYYYVWYIIPYTASLGDGKTIYCDNAYDSSVVLKDKWESAVKGTKAIPNEIFSIDSTKILFQQMLKKL